MMFLGICSDSFSHGQFPISHRSHSGDLSEGCEEVILVLVPELEGNLLYGLGSICEQFLGHVYARLPLPSEEKQQ